MICFAQLFVWPDCAQRSRAGYQLCNDWEQLIVLFYQFWQAWWIINWCFIETSLGKSINIASHRITRIIQTNDNNNKNGRSMCQHEPQKMTQRINKCHDKKKITQKLAFKLQISNICPDLRSIRLQCRSKRTKTPFKLTTTKAQEKENHSQNRLMGLPSKRKRTAFGINDGK